MKYYSIFFKKIAFILAFFVVPHIFGEELFERFKKSVKEVANDIESVARDIVKKVDNALDEIRTSKTFIVIDKKIDVVSDKFDEDWIVAIGSSGTIKDAYENMTPELKACQTLDEIKDLLNKQCQQAFHDVCNEYKLSDAQKNELIAQINAGKQKANEYYQRPLPANQLKRDAAFEPNDIKSVEDMLQDAGINPKSVHIIWNKESSNRASAGSSFTIQGHEATLHDPTLHFRPNAIKDTGTICHEISHLLSHDGLESSLLLWNLEKLGHNRQNVENNKIYQKYNQTYELRADILLLIDPKYRSIFKKEYNHHLLCAMAANHSKDDWYKPCEDNIHPGHLHTCMWYIKAWDLANKPSSTKS